MLQHNAARVAGAAAYGAAETLLAVLDPQQRLLDAENGEIVDSAATEIAAYVIDTRINQAETVWRQFHGVHWSQGSTALPWPDCVTPEWALALDVFTQVAGIVGPPVKAKQASALERAAQAAHMAASLPMPAGRIRAATIFERHGSAFERTEAFERGNGAKNIVTEDEADAAADENEPVAGEVDREALGLTIGAVEHEAVDLETEKQKNHTNKIQR